MDKDIREALVEICDVLKEKVTFDRVRRQEKELAPEADRLSKRLAEMIAKLKVGSYTVLAEVLLMRWAGLLYLHLSS